MRTSEISSGCWGEEINGRNAGFATRTNLKAALTNGDRDSEGQDCLEESKLSTKGCRIVWSISNIVI